ncbi:Bifunctional methyltransferase [Bienertia sinuspersici]
MSSLSNSLVLTRNSPSQLSSGFCSKQSDLHVLCPTNLSVSPHCTRKVTQKPLTVRASYSDGGRPNSASIFVSGFVLGGIVVGTLGAVYAPQISKALAGADKKDLMRKLPKFIYDEEKALEKTRKILTEKIEQLNSAIDDVSSQLRSEGAPNGAAVNSDEVEGLEATI